MWQEVIVAIVVAAAVIGLLRSLIGKVRHGHTDNPCHSQADGCTGCPLKEGCQKPSKKK